MRQFNSGRVAIHFGLYIFLRPAIHFGSIKASAAVGSGVHFGSILGVCLNFGVINFWASSGPFWCFLLDWNTATKTC